MPVTLSQQPSWTSAKILFNQVVQVQRYYSDLEQGHLTPFTSENWPGVSSFKVGGDIEM
jgi:hypothetical protein